MAKAIQKSRIIRVIAALLLALSGSAHVRGGGESVSQSFAVEGRFTELVLRDLLTSPDKPWKVAIPDSNRRVQDLQGDLLGGKLVFSIKLKKDPGRSAVRLSVFTQNKFGWFYKSTKDFLLTHRKSRLIEIDLSADSSEMVPAGNARPWNETSSMALRSIGLALYANGGYDGGVEVSEARISGGTRKPSLMVGENLVEGLKIKGQLLGRMTELEFGLPVAFANPFDPKIADITAQITGNGLKLIVPAFIDQRYAPVLEGFSVRFIPIGPSRWKVRFLPRRVGTYKVELFWCQEKLAEVNVPVSSNSGFRRKNQTSGLDSEAAGFAERAEIIGSDQDGGRCGRIFGEEFFRVLPRDPSRSRSFWSSKGFEVPQAAPAGLSGWIAPLEWTAEWGSWLGLGRYNLEAAWKLDLVLARARRSGLSRPLFLNFDGQLSSSGRHPLAISPVNGKYTQTGRYRWSFNPLNVGQGGPLRAIGEYYSNPVAEQDSKVLFRYLLARYGQHPAVSGIVLGASFPADGVGHWHQRVGKELARWLPEEDGQKACRLSSLHPQAVTPRLSVDIGSFEPSSVKGWQFDTEVGPKVKADYAKNLAAHGSRSLKISCLFPGELFCIFKPLDMNCWRYTHVSFDAYLPTSVPENMHVRAMVYLRDRELNWYQALLSGELRRGEWTRLLLDLRPGRSGLTPVLADARQQGVVRPWDDYSRQRLKVLGVRLFASVNPVSGVVDEVKSDLNSSSAVEKSKGYVCLDRIRLSSVLTPPTQVKERPTKFLNFLTENARTPDVFSKVEYSFSLDRAFENPFDPECVDVRARVTDPDGKQKIVSGFFYQGYLRILSDTLDVKAIERDPKGGSYGYVKKELKAVNGVEKLLPVGGSQWRIRLAPLQAGKHTVEIEVLVPGAKGGKQLIAQKGDLSFDARKGNRKGFVRVAADSRHLEHSSGEFFYPIGMALRSPSDDRDLRRDQKIATIIRGDSPVLLHIGNGHREYLDLLHERGTYQFDSYLEACGRSNVNWARIWMCPWWLGLEWDHRYPGYEGAGRYNLANAWRMDHVLETAAQNGVYLQISLTNHGQVTAKIDRQWDFNPLNKVMPEVLWNPPDRPALGNRLPRPGGFLEYPRDFFTNVKARKLFKQRMRYTIARWGYSPYIMGLALMSEVEFTGGTKYSRERSWDGKLQPLQAAWHKEMAAYIHSIDPYKHLVTTHYSHPQNGSDVWATRHLDYVQSNAYSAFGMLGGTGKTRGLVGAPRAMIAYYDKYMARYNRPVLVGEWGGHWMRNPKEILDAELHTGLWAQIATPMGGATGYWWWLHVHFNNRYEEFDKLSRFVSGEDFRGVVKRLNISVTGKGATGLKCMGVGDGRSRAFLYLYARELVSSLERKRAFAEGTATISLSGVGSGKIGVEFWDTWTGRKISRKIIETSQAQLLIELPAFNGDLAIKIQNLSPTTVPSGDSRPASGRTPSSGSPSQTPSGTRGPRVIRPEK